MKRIRILKATIWQRLNSLIPWSSIASIGNSTPARLTALAPLIGYLAIYNQFIAEFFFLSENDLRFSDSAPSILDLFSELKLTFLYFGLLFFGIGAIFFALFAPRSIKKYKTPEEYVLAMGAAQTDWLVVDSLTRVGSSAWSGHYFYNPDSYSATSLSFTEDTFYQLDAILEYAGRSARVFDEEEEPGEPDEHHPNIRFFNAMGNVMTEI